MSTCLLIAQPDTSAVAEPSQGAFDDVPPGTQSAAALLTWASQQRPDAACVTINKIVRRSIGPIAEEDLGLRPRASARSLHRRDGIEHRDGGLRIVKVGRTRADDQRDAVRVRDDMPFAASFRTIRGIGAGVRPPKTARMLALSMTARDRSMRSSLPSTRSNFAWTAGQTPACVQSRRRRQQVTPEPQPISVGMNRHGMPVRNTYTMPVRQARSGTRGRPPSGLGGSAGRRGWTSFHRSSDTSVNAIASPPCLAWHSVYRSKNRF